jgi:hypothetical protein
MILTKGCGRRSSSDDYRRCQHRRDARNLSRTHNKQAGFRLLNEEQHHSFGKDLTAETWELDLRTTA